MAFGDIMRSAASPQDFPRGIGGNAVTIWHSSLSDPKNYELSVSDFSVIRQANAPDTKPTDVGGDSNKVWHCDYQAQKVYELSSSDLSVVRTSSSPGTWPSGIGGCSSKIWYGDGDENKVYELSTSDFGVIRSETAPGIGDEMWGIGGSESVIWFRSGPDPSTILIYKLSVEDFSVLHSVEAPTWHPGGLGGDDGVIWYCNYGSGEKKVYELDETTTPKEPRIFIHCYDYATSDYAIWSFTAEGVFVHKWTAPMWNQENNICVDSAHNVYMTDIADGAWNVIKKWDKNGTLLKSKTTDWTEGIAIGPDGYLYTRQLGLEEFGETYVIVKRDPDTLEAVSHIVMPNVSRWFTFDSDGYFYIRDKVDVWGIAKWDYDSATRIAFHTVSFWNNWCSSAYTDGLVAFSCDGCGVSTIPTSLDEDPTHWTGSGAGGPGASIHIAGINATHFIVAETTGSYPDIYYNIRKYTSAGSVVWDKNIEHTNNITVYGIAAYPFPVDKEAPWKEDVLEPTGEVKVEIPRRSGEWTSLEDVMRIHSSNGKDTSSPRAPVEIGQAEVTCCNISKNFNSFEEASEWYKKLVGYAIQIKIGYSE